VTVGYDNDKMLDIVLHGKPKVDIVQLSIYKDNLKMYMVAYE
jgi:hypothetical protein